MHLTPPPLHLVLNGLTRNDKLVILLKAGDNIHFSGAIAVSAL
jgi:hypothetical protein